MKILTQRDLLAKGITWSAEHTRRQWEAGKFPRPFKLSDRGRNVWTEEEIDVWLEQRVSLRSKQRAIPAHVEPSPSA
jgi:predicted DNA-binding transcriptional regulator AlpA